MTQGERGATGEHGACNGPTLYSAFTICSVLRLGCDHQRRIQYLRERFRKQKLHGAISVLRVLSCVPAPCDGVHLALESEVFEGGCSRLNIYV